MERPKIRMKNDLGLEQKSGARTLTDVLHSNRVTRRTDRKKAKDDTIIVCPVFTRQDRRLRVCNRRATQSIRYMN